MTRRLGVAAAVASAALALGVSPAWAGTISGSVTDAATRTAPDDYICVLALDAAGDAAGSTATDSAGGYALSGLAAGAYRVEFVDDGGCLSQAGRFAFQYYPGAAGPAQAAPVTVTAGAVTGGIDAAMQPGGGITGRVAAAGSGQPLPGVCARLLDPQGGFIQQQRTDRTGAYDLEQLPAGSYKLEFVDDACTGEAQAYAPQYFAAQATLAQADPITVLAGQTMTGVDARLVPAGKATGGSGGGGSGGSGTGAGGHPSPPPLPRGPRSRVLVRLLLSRTGVALDRRGRFTLSVRCLAGSACEVRIAVRIARGPARAGTQAGVLVARTPSGSPVRIRSHRRRSIQLRLLAPGRRLIGVAAAHPRLRVHVVVTAVAGLLRSRLSSGVVTIRGRPRR